MKKSFLKKIDYTTLVNEYASLMRTSDASHNATSETLFSAGAPLMSDIFPLSVMKSCVFSDIFTKRQKQLGKNVVSYQSSFLDSMYWRVLRDKEKITQVSSSITSLFDGLGFISDGGVKQSAFTDFVSDTFRKHLDSGVIRYNLDVRYWSIQAQTVVSDSQLVSYEHTCDRYFIKFFIDTKKHTIVATLDDPLLLFGASGLAVNPYDKRYKKFVGKNVIVPIINKKIPVIADERIIMSNDTGAIVLCPAHNRLHFQIAQDHSLSCDLYSLDKEGFFTARAGEFAGKYAFDFKDNITQYLRDISNLERIEQVPSKLYKNKYNVDHTLIPLATLQWFFVGVNQHLTDTMQAHNDGVLDEELFGQFFVEDPICISKQTQGTHRFPLVCQGTNVVAVINSGFLLHVYNALSSKPQNFVLTHMSILLILQGSLSDSFSLEDFILALHTQKNGEYIYQEMCAYLQSLYIDFPSLLKELEMVQKMLETSFSDPLVYEDIAVLLEKSFALLYNDDGSFAICWKSLGCGDDSYLVLHTIDAAYFSALHACYLAKTTTRDVSQGVLSASTSQLSWLKFLLAPGMVQAQETDTRVFSKSASCLLSTKDSHAILSSWGPDVTRVSILFELFDKEGLQEAHADMYKRFINKFWNAARFMQKSFADIQVPQGFDLEMLAKDILENQDNLNDFDTWMLFKLHAVAQEIHFCYDKKNYAEGLRMLIKSAWYDLCDCYIEVNKSKPSVYSYKILLYVFGCFLQLLYPYMPFVSHGLWERLGYVGSLDKGMHMTEIEGLTKNYKFGMLMDMVVKWKHLHAQHRHVHVNQELVLLLQSNRDFIEFSKEYENFLCSMLGASRIVYHNEQEILSDQWFVDRVVNIVIGVSYVEPVVEQKVDIDALQKKLQDTNQLLQNMRSIVFSLDSSTPEYSTYQEKITDLKGSVEELEYAISKAKYGL